MASLPILNKLSARSGLAKKSAALDKASIISIAKRSALNESCADSHVAINGVEDEVPWHAISTAEEVCDELAVSSSTGLSAAEAERRFKDFGPNLLTPPKKRSFLEKVWSQLNNVLIWLLFAAAIVEGALQSWAEFGLVLGVIVINTAIGLIQEGKAEKAADAIKAMLSPNAVVLRDGERRTIPADQLVPGDLVKLKSGDKVPADLRLLQATNLQVQEAMLTGESVPVSKHLHAAPPAASLGDRRCMCYSATAVVSGQAQGVVVATGDSAEIGQINKMVNTVENIKNNLIHQLEILGRWLAVLVAVIAVIAFLLAMLYVGLNFQGAFESAVSIAVAIIPEGLPAMVTIVLAIGTTVMAKNNAIIRQLPAVETLGSLTVICSDKTGTLTKNEMSAVQVRTAANVFHVQGVGYAPEGIITCENGGPLRDDQMTGLQQMLRGVVLCNDSVLQKATDNSLGKGGKVIYKPLGAPTEVSLLTLGEKAGLKGKAVQQSAPRVASVPFESEHKFMATVHTENGKRVMYVKGAPDRLLPLCDSQVEGVQLSQSGPLDAKYWKAAQAEMSSQGLRVLALCRAELPERYNLESLSAKSLLQQSPSGLAMVLMVAILDPPREEAVAAIREAHAAGITVKMITGDHSLTALAIGRMLGIAGKGVVFTGPEIDRTNDEALKHIVMQCNVFARASPENKLRIVRALQELRQTVAMTGDGVNDAPALKAADCGVAMGITGTDVSKEAANMVLADDNFATIVAAIKEGRRVWDNIRKILVFNLPVNLAQGTSVLYAYILAFPAAPLTALQVLLVNLVTSVTLGLALAAEPAEPTVMSRAPRRPGKRLIGKLLLWRCFFVCHLIVVLVLGAFYWGGVQGFTLAQRRAEAFCVLVGSQVAYCITCRFLKMSTLHSRVFRGNKVIYASVFITLALVVFLVYTPAVNTFFHMEGMTGLQWARSFVCIAIVYLVVEIEKALVDPVLMPIIRPMLAWIERHTPKWLTVERPMPARVVFGRLCGGDQPTRTRSQMRKLQRKGSVRKAGVQASDVGGIEAGHVFDGSLTKAAAAAAAVHGGAAGAGVDDSACTNQARNDMVPEGAAADDRNNLTTAGVSMVALELDEGPSAVAATVAKSADSNRGPESV